MSIVIRISEKKYNVLFSSCPILQHVIESQTCHLFRDYLLFFCHESVWNLFWYQWFFVGDGFVCYVLKCMLKYKKKIWYDSQWYNDPPHSKMTYISSTIGYCTVSIYLKSVLVNLSSILCHFRWYLWLTAVDVFILCYETVFGVVIETITPPFHIAWPIPSTTISSSIKGAQPTHSEHLCQSPVLSVIRIDLPPYSMECFWSSLQIIIFFLAYTSSTFFINFTIWYLLIIRLISYI